MDKFSYLGTSDVNAIEQLFTQYTNDNNSVDKTWQDFFKGFEFAQKDYSSSNGAIPENVTKEFKVINLINGYRSRGHLFTRTNPVRQRRTYTPTLALENFELSDKDLETVFQAGNQIGIGAAKLKDIIAHLETTYCASIGVEYAFLRNPEETKWLQDRIEKSKNIPNFNKNEKKVILNKLIQAVTFENFLATKFVGQKRFSLEGGESFLPALNTLMEHGVKLGIEDYVIGMAHRGRLNVLANIMNKPTKDIFTEFEGRPSEDSVFDGDVKYHMGYSSDIKSDSGKQVHISLTPNPSHLETVAPVVGGITRAKIDIRHKGDNKKACSISIHGDGAIAAQGIVYEVIQMSQLDGYKTGGTVHFVINNQVSFTTNFIDARSSIYCTDVAKVVLSPVFHVNGDDVEALALVAKLAMDYRQTFGKDVFIDVLCYRKYGHNEGDEPRFTQPLLYKEIAKHPNPKEIYAQKLIDEKSFTTDEIKTIETQFKNELEQNLDEARKTEKAKMTSFLQGSWNAIKMATSTDFDESPKTAIDAKLFLELATKSSQLPKDKKFFNKIEKLFNDRQNMIANNNYDWAMGELLAYASLMHEGHHVRFSGQDVERGTFSHRHAVIKVEDSEEEYTPLNNIGTTGKIEIYNSLLSEYGVLGFEYGYAYAAPNALTIWEAQFGDFFNGAQIIIDQYLSSSEYKWRRMNGLVMLLPHGYEGQGAEHSSARMERYLQLCARHNMFVADCTTPANFFHLLRRQMKTKFRKPLVVFTPKSLLRHPLCVSTREELFKGQFQETIDDKSVDKEKVKTVVFCTGKFYYDILAERENVGRNDVALVRIEQLFPLPVDQLKVIIKGYTNADDFVWAQEEPKNMGAYSFMLMNFDLVKWRLASLKAYAAPAAGSHTRDRRRHADAIRMVFDKNLFR